jgi:RNA polymerase sigma factor
MGVLNGAEKFDSQKGCKFSTYVKYWIRKGMLALLVENSGVTLLPVCNHHRLLISISNFSVNE